MSTLIAVLPALRAVRVVGAFSWPLRYQDGIFVILERFEEVGSTLALFTLCSVTNLYFLWRESTVLEPETKGWNIDIDMPTFDLFF